MYSQSIQFDYYKHKIIQKSEITIFLGNIKLDLLNYINIKFLIMVH